MKRITQTALGRTLLCGCAAVTLSACAGNSPGAGLWSKIKPATKASPPETTQPISPDTDSSKTATDEAGFYATKNYRGRNYEGTAYRGHIVNSMATTASPLPPALRSAREAQEPFTARPDKSPYVAPDGSAPLQLAPLANGGVMGQQILPPALRLSGAPAKPYSPIIATSPSLRPIMPYDSLPKATAFAPIVIDTAPKGLEAAPNRATLLVNIDPSLTTTAHFKRPLAGYQTLAAADRISEPVRANVETFRQAIASSYQNSPSLKAERTRVSETDENYIQARAQGRPAAQFDATAGYTAQRVPRSSFGQASSLETETGKPRDATLSIRQPLYEGGRIRALKSRAKFGISAARERLRDAEQSTTLQAATAYIDVIRDRKIAGVRRENLRLVMRQQEAAEDRFEVGVGTETDIFQAMARVAEAEIILAEAEAQLIASQSLYERIVGHAPLTLTDIPALSMPESVERAQAVARRNNPRLRALAYDFDAAKSAVDVAEAAGSPTLALTASASTEREQLTGLSRRDDATLALELRVPLYSGGLNRSRERAAEITKNRLYFEVLETDRALDSAVASVWAEHEAAILSRDEAKVQVEAAERAYNFIQQEQLLGQRALIDVLDTERELVDARARLSIAERNIHRARFDLLSFMGVFDAFHLVLPVELYDPAAYLNDVAKNPFSRGKPKAVIKEWEQPAPPKGLPFAPWR